MAQKTRLFGTDGIRGHVNQGLITPDKIMRIGMAAGTYFKNRDTARHSVVIGKDTRLSGYMIEPALVAGFAAVGMDVKLFGPLPTPGVSLLTRTLRADLGVMITASHNPFFDNGLKFFGPDGRKLASDAEHAIEALMQDNLDDHLCDGDTLGRVERLDDVQARYIEIVKGTFPRRMRLSGLRIVIDCANGAAHRVGPKVLWELGADEVISIGVSPNGTNINQHCGSTATDTLSAKVIETGADLGIALDGDADRLIMCDETGKIIDGDQLLALIAHGWAKNNQLAQPGIVATVMSNLGLERFMHDQDMTLIRTDVGDRHVATRMRQDGYNVGGEQSGHILMTDFSPTGDGLIAAMQILAEIVRADRPASELLHVFDPVPQRLVNVQYTGASPMENIRVTQAIQDAEADLGHSGRILVRASGTEPVIRIMAEADDMARVTAITDALADLIKRVTA